MRKSRRLQPSIRGMILTLLAPLLCLGSIIQAQDAVRPSLAGEASAEARRQSIDRIPYNLLAGPIRFRFSTTFGVEYNDNINLSEVNEQSDVILRPQFNMNALWPVTQLNTLRLNLGVGYAFYLDHSDANTNSILVTPGSQLAFDIYVSDFRINFHDRFSVQQDPIGQIALSNVVDYGRFQNTAGVSVLWDLNTVVLTLGYDHYNYVSTTSRFDYLDRSAEQLTASADFAVSSTTGVGLESSLVWNTYDQNVLDDSTTINIGAFVETQVTNNLKFRLAGGYQSINFDDTGLILNPEDLNDYYANLLLSHRLNGSISQTIAAGHESQLGINSNFITLNYVRHTITWNIFRDTLLSTEFFYEDAEDGGGGLNEQANRYGGAITVGYQFTQHVTLGARYQYTQKDSNIPFRSYEQNRISVDGTYSF
jgi:hypothetical protein